MLGDPPCHVAVPIAPLSRPVTLLRVGREAVPWNPAPPPGPLRWGAQAMTLRTFAVSATVVTTADPSGVREAVSDAFGRGVVVRAADHGLTVEVTSVVGVESRELNRRLFRAVQSVDDAAQLLSEWSADGVCERYRGWVFVKGRQE